MAQYKQIQLTVILIASTFSSLSYGAGFAIQEQSVTGMGRAFAGSAAVADDVSTTFFNPAGLTYLKHSEVAGGLQFIFLKSDFDNNGSSLPGALGGGAITGKNDDGGTSAIVPNFYYAHKLTDTTVFGIGVNAPFGLVTEYDDDWVGRYHAIKSDLKTININPSFAFKATDKLSLGFGVNLQYIDLELTQAVDFGAVCAKAGAPGTACNTPQAFDGKAKLTADDWSWGYNLGLIYQATEATRLGLSYRSKVSHHLTGDGKWTIPDNATVQAVAAGAGFTNNSISGDVDLPETASFALFHQINDKWALMGDVTWTRWSRFQDLTINSATGNRLNSSKEEKWGNSVRYGLGLNYSYNDKWTFRTGVAYDETPVPDKQHRTARIPDNDRKWLSVGASYKWKENLIIDAAYSHLFISDPKIDETDSNGYNLNGKYEASVDLLGVQMRWLLL